MKQFDFLWDTFLQLLAGVPVTVSLVTVSVVLGGVLALGLTGIRRTSRPGEWVVSA